MQASPEALGRISQALSLSRAERDYLFKLAGRLDPEGSRGPSADAPPSLIAAVKAIESPAYGLDRLWNACCWNEAAARLFRGWLDGDCQRNLLRYVFLEPSARDLIPSWKDRARRLLAEFRADFARTFRDTQVRIFVETLRSESAFFAEAWDEQAVQSAKAAFVCSITRRRRREFHSTYIRPGGAARLQTCHPYAGESLKGRVA